jgi:hypothetical protein
MLTVLNRETYESEIKELKAQAAKYKSEIGNFKEENERLLAKNRELADSVSRAASELSKKR